MTKDTFMIGNTFPVWKSLMSSSPDTLPGATIRLRKPTSERVQANYSELQLSLFHISLRFLTFWAISIDYTEEFKKFFKKDLIFYSGCAIISNVVNLGVAQLGRALPWGGRGRGFKSRHSDHTECFYSIRKVL